MEHVQKWSKFFFPIHTLFLFSCCVYLQYALEDATKHKLTLHMPVSSTESIIHWYNFYTCQVLHIDAAHLWNNMSLLLSLGLILEALHGSLCALGIFWIGGTTGTMLEVGWWSGPQIRLSGASAGIYALVAAYFSHLVINWKETPLRKVWAIYLVIGTVYTIVYYYMYRASHEIAHLAHIGGAIQGFLVGCVVVRNVRVTRLENLWKFVCFLLSSGFIASVSYRLTLKKCEHIS